MQSDYRYLIPRRTPRPTPTGQAMPPPPSPPPSTSGLAAVRSEDIDSCLQVLRAISTDIDGFLKPPTGVAWAKDYRRLRKDLMPLVEQLSSRMYGGKRPEEYKGERFLRKEQRAAKAQALSRDEQAINGTRLRNARLMALHKLQGQEHHLGSVKDLVPPVPDGAVDTTAEITSSTMIDAAIGDAAAAQGAWMAFYSTTSQGRNAKSSGGATKALADGSAAVKRARLDEGAVVREQLRQQHHQLANRLEDKQQQQQQQRDEIEALMPPACAQQNRVLEASERSCYICKRRFRRLHHFYDSLCPSCADLNWRKRHQSVSLEGRIALVTGAFMRCSPL